jgi:hypothetical protein
MAARAEAPEKQVTSVQLDKEDLAYINESIAEGRSRSMKDFVELCVKFGRRYTMDQWMRGVFNAGPVRVVVVPKRVIDSLLQRIKEEDYEDIGRELAEVMQSIAMFQFNVDTTNPDMWAVALKLMSETGLGSFVLSENHIQVIRPILPLEINQKFIEGTLNVKTIPKRVVALDVQLFEIEKR